MKVFYLRLITGEYCYYDDARNITLIAQNSVGEHILDTTIKLIYMKAKFSFLFGIFSLISTTVFAAPQWTIAIDPGHGGKDPGAVYYNTNEKDLTMQVYKKLRKELEGLGYTVLSSRDSDVYVDFVTERSKMVNNTNIWYLH